MGPLRDAEDRDQPHGAEGRPGRIQNSDDVELFGVSQAHASSVLKDLAGPDSGDLLAPGRTPNLGRDAHYVAGDGFPPHVSG